MGHICPPQHTWNPQWHQGVLGTARRQDVAPQHTLVLSFSCLLHTGPTNTPPALSFPHVLLPLSLRHSWDCQVVMQLFHVSHSTQQSRPAALSHTKWCLSNTSQELPHSSQDCFIPSTQGLWNLSRQMPSSLSHYQSSFSILLSHDSGKGQLRTFLTVLLTTLTHKNKAKPQTRYAITLVQQGSWNALVLWFKADVNSRFPSLIT